MCLKYGIMCFRKDKRMENGAIGLLANLVTAAVAATFGLIKAIAALIKALKKGKSE